MNPEQILETLSGDELTALLRLNAKEYRPYSKTKISTVTYRRLCHGVSPLVCCPGGPKVTSARFKLTELGAAVVDLSNKNYHEWVAKLNAYTPPEKVATAPQEVPIEEHMDIITMRRMWVLDRMQPSRYKWMKDRDAKEVDDLIASVVEARDVQWKAALDEEASVQTKGCSCHEYPSEGPCHGCHIALGIEHQTTSRMKDLPVMSTVTKTASPWISVADGLPEANTDVLIYVPQERPSWASEEYQMNTGISVACLVPDSREDFKPSGLRWHTDGPSHNSVKFWMPLPTAPK